jgi:cysteine desulfurase family protein (TIGR01976 family)
MITGTAPTVEELRAQFPSLQLPVTFMENAGGSQLPGVVIDAVQDYMRTCFVQHGAPYAISQRATQFADDAHAFTLRLFGGEGAGHAIIGPSTSVLCQTLAQAYAPKLAERPEVIIAECGHEANVGPWTRIGANVRWWKVNPETQRCEFEDLRTLLSEKTLVVALPHVSNILGEVTDLGPIVEAAHAVGAKVVVDGVAYAPHRLMEVADWNVDWYLFSHYKVYAPHSAALFGRFEAFEGLVGPNHFFVRSDDIPYKFELGGVNHEAMAGIVALQRYVNLAAGVTDMALPNSATRDAVVKAFGLFTALELPLQKQLLDFLANEPDVRVVGPVESGLDRVPTISFLHKKVTPPEVSAHLSANGIAMRHGHMYSYRLLEALGIAPDPGVVRISLVHTNTTEEVSRLIDTLKEIFLS